MMDVVEQRDGVDGRRSRNDPEAVGHFTHALGDIARPLEGAEKVARLGGTQFDPEVVEAMMAVWRQLELPPNLRSLKSRMVPHENRASPRVSECGEVYHVHE